MLVALLLVGCGPSHPRSGPKADRLSALDRAISQVGTTRGGLLATVNATQSAATQLDHTDELSAAGQGAAARQAFQSVLPVLHSARAGQTGFVASLAAYGTALLALDRSTPTAPASAQGALRSAVREGRVEALALQRFRAALGALWPAYDQLAADEDLWTTRAAGGWYRSSQEAAAAYSVQVQDHRAALQSARDRLASAASALDGPSRSASSALAAADRALAGLRAKA